VSRGVDEVRNFITGWFSTHEFVVLEWQSRGAQIVHKTMWGRWTLHPRPGSIVAIKPTSMSNALAIEAMLVPDPAGTLVHGEFYFPPMGLLEKEENDVNPKALNKWGLREMTDFVQTIGQMGVIAAPAPSSPQSQYQRPMAGGQAQPAFQGGTTSQQPQPGLQMPPGLETHAAAQSQSQQPHPQATMAAPTPQVQQSAAPVGQPAVQSQSQQGATPQVIYCTYCGKALKPVAKFCVQCGRPTD